MNEPAAQYVWAYCPSEPIARYSREPVARNLLGLLPGPIAPISYFLEPIALSLLLYTSAYCTTISDL